MKEYSEIEDYQIIENLYITNQECDALLISQNQKIIIRKWQIKDQFYQK
jgi:hypothetical protein